MAEVIGVLSGLLAVATFAFQSSITLSNTIRSYRHHPKRVRDLNEELEALSGVLNALIKTINGTVDIDLSPLQLPLQRCGDACKEFQQEIIKLSSQSGSDRTSFRDWAKLRYMGDGIDGFRQMVAGYKSSINIALTNANLRKISLTAERLERYRDQIQTCTDDLEARLQSIDEKLENIVECAVSESESDANELQLIQKERLATQKCLEVCNQLSEHINQIQLQSLEQASPGTTDLEVFPKNLTKDGLQRCRNEITMTIAKLEQNMQDLMDRLMAKSRTIMTSEDITDLARLREEWQAARQFMHICSQADNNLNENVSVIENYSTGDENVQVMITDGRTLRGKNRACGRNTRQLGGHMDSMSVQQLSRDFARISAPNIMRASSSLRDSPPSGCDDIEENGHSSEVWNHYGRGFSLTPDPVSATATLSKANTGGYSLYSSPKRDPV